MRPLPALLLFQGLLHDSCATVASSTKQKKLHMRSAALDEGWRPHRQHKRCPWRRGTCSMCGSDGHSENKCRGELVASSLLARDHKTACQRKPGVYSSSACKLPSHSSYDRTLEFLMAGRLAGWSDPQNDFNPQLMQRSPAPKTVASEVDRQVRGTPAREPSSAALAQPHRAEPIA